MEQTADKVLDHHDLFKQPQYTEMFARKREQFENRVPEEQLKSACDWSKGAEYRELNFNRQALTVNPAKACQPLGAVFAALGFEKTLPFVHGSQGCVAYFRSHLTRHFKEPTACVSSSMTEDAAVFGGLTNLIDGLQNARALYKPDSIAVSTTCMAEVIGDDLKGFIENARNKDAIPKDYPVPFAHTPSFVGSHVTGYDNMMKGVLVNYWTGATRVPNDSINFIGGFDGFAPGNLREIKRIFGLMGVEATILSDVSDIFDTPTDGEYRMYDGGTPLAAVKAAINAKATVSFQESCSEKTLKFAAENGQAVKAFNHPMGVAGTDAFLMAISELTGKPIPDSLRKERGRLVDAIADSQSYVHGKKYAVYGDPDFCLGMAQFLLELGAEPTHVLATNGDEDWAIKVRALFDASPFGKGCRAWPKRDLWHLRSLLFTEPVDFLIGNSHGKYLERDCGTPLIRLSFPIFDRHHYHRTPIVGYEGAQRVLTMLLDEIFEKADLETIETGVTDISFDLVR